MIIPKIQPVYAHDVFIDQNLHLMIVHSDDLHNKNAELHRNTL
jgi:hypothetical protein